MSNEQRKMHLGAFLYGVGHHVAAWRHPAVDPGRLFQFSFYKELAQKAEAAKFDMLFFADNVGLLNESLELLSCGPPPHPWEPLELLAALATHTSRIGLTATVSTSYIAPYHVARKFATLDRISGGRAAWNLVTSGTDLEAANFGLDRQAPHAERYVRARDHVGAVRALWDSWDDDAWVIDKASGRFFDPSRVRPANFAGQFHRTRGPLQTGRPVQGWPVLVQAGSSDDGQQLAAETAEVVFTAQQTLEGALAFARGLKDRVEKAGRPRDSLKIMPGVSIYVAPTREEAQAKLDLLQRFVDPRASAQGFKAVLDWDVGDADLDAPPPPPPFTEGWQSRQKLAYDLAINEGLTLRQLIGRLSAARGHWVLTGTPADIADNLQHWFEAGAADGFNILSPTFPGGFDDIIQSVLPELRRRGLFREDYEGTTLRDHLGLTRPANIHHTGA